MGRAPSDRFARNASLALALSAAACTTAGPPPGGPQSPDVIPLVELQPAIAADSALAAESDDPGTQAGESSANTAAGSPEAGSQSAQAPSAAPAPYRLDPPGLPDPDSWTERTLASLTLEEKAGQLMMPILIGDYAPTGTSAERRRAGVRQ